MNRLFCKHDWKVLSETTTESRMSHAVSMGIEFKTKDSTLIERKFIQIIICEKCGKLKRFVEDI